MSRLFLATDLRLKRDVVVKVLPPDLLSDASTSRFKREIELTVRLQHPHILPILTSGEFEDGLFYITPYIHGESLRARIQREGKLPLDDILRILKDISGALAFAHQRGIVHRDIKPGNILLSEGQAVLGDFGIARAVSATATPLTASGVTPGTPAYMAPELPTDERADVYALGVVAYEMLTGVLPDKPPTVKRIVALRGSDMGDPRATFKQTCELVVKCLAQSPSDRPASARGLSDSLNELLSPAAAYRRALRLGAVAVTGTIVVGLTASWIHRSTAELLSEHRYVVLPITTDANDSSNALQIRQGLSDALSRWRGIDVSRVPTRPAAWRQAGSVSRESADAISVARALGAAYAVSGSASHLGDSIFIQTSLQDARTGTIVRRAVVAAQRGRLEDAVWQLASRLLRDGAEVPSRVGGVEPFPSLEAWRAYDAGHSDLAAWNLDAAAAHFREALRADSLLGPASFWLAETLLLNGRPTDNVEWRAQARRAASLQMSLSGPARRLANPLRSLAERDFKRACIGFAAATSADSSDLFGWLGRGDCQRLDSLVIRDVRSPSGFSYRSSLNAAANAYRQASQVVNSDVNPRFHGWLLARLSSVLFPNLYRVRLGYSEAQSVWLAYSTINHDTLCTTPYPQNVFAAGTVDPAPRAREAAVRWSRDVLREEAEEWVRRSATVESLDSLAGLTEVSGAFAFVGGRRWSALEVLRRARSMPADSAERRRLAVSEVRLLIKANEFHAAARLADSILRYTLATSDPLLLAGMAAVVGRPSQVAKLLSIAEPELRTGGGANPKSDPLPEAVVREASRSLALAAFAPNIADSARL